MSDIPEMNFVDFGGDMESLMSAEAEQVTQEFNGGEKVTGTVTLISSSSVFVNIKAKSEGILPKAEFLDNDGQLTVAVGDEIEAYYINDFGGEITLTTKMSGEALIASLGDAFANQIPVEGKVSEERKGGFTVTLAAGLDAFCPFSQIYRVRSEGAQHVGQTYTFVITKLGDRDCVVSRRAILEKEAELRKVELQEELEEGDIVEGTIRNIASFGVFVDLGGVDGLVPMSELSWKRNFDASELVSIGDKVTVRIRGLDWEKDRILLSLRAANDNPWDNIDNYHTSTPYKATVTALKDFGAFLELEPGIEGLLHISKIGAGRHLTHADEELSVGDEVEVYIDSIDFEGQRISLNLEPSQTAEGHDKSGVPSGHSNAVVVGNTLTGVVDSVKNYGAFIKLNDKKSGLLHVSTLDLPKGANVTKALEERFTEGAEIEVEVQRIESGRISLCLPGMNAAAEDRQAVQSYIKSHAKDSNSFGSIGGLFDGL